MQEEECRQIFMGHVANQLVWNLKIKDSHSAKIR